MYYYKLKILLTPEFYNLPIEQFVVFEQLSVYVERILHLSSVKQQKHLVIFSTLTKNIIFVLNPDGDLIGTQERLEGLFKERIFWIGYYGKTPPMSEIITRLKQGYLYM